MRTCFALSGLWQIGSSAYPGRRCTQGDGAPRVALRSTLGYLIMPRWGERSGYGSVLIANSRRPKLCWVIRDGVYPMVLCPNGAQGIAGSLNEARWFYAPTGRKGIAQGKAKRRPGIRYEIIFASPERAGKKPGTVPTRYFNGAPTWKSRKVARRHVAEMLGHWASMGPRLGSRGKQIANSTNVVHGNGFNGAATWKSRKVTIRDHLKSENLMLQWGRDLKVAESGH